MAKKETILKQARQQFETPNLKKRRLKKCLKPLLDLGDPEAILLFDMLTSNSSVEQSIATAQKAANTGFPPAISHLAEIHYNQGNYDKAYYLYQKAADLEEPHALYVLSAVYKLGIDGFEKNLKLSQEYEERAKKAKKWDFTVGYNDEYIMYE